MTNEKSRLIVEEKREVGEYTLEMIAWEVPVSVHYPHGISYRLWFGCRHQTLVLYDVHHGKPYHKHVGGREFGYEFTDLEILVNDFLADTEKFT